VSPRAAGTEIRASHRGRKNDGKGRENGGGRLMLIGEEAPLSVDIRYFGFRTPGFPLPTFIDAVIVLLDADEKPLLNHQFIEQKS
jgi:hypothetical protein